jgi:multisubunit Na+/H+ antiporter MnhB subunit
LLTLYSQLDLKLENAKIRVAGKVTLLPLMTESGTTDMSFPPQTLTLEYPIDSLTATVMLLLVLDEKEILDMTVASMTNKTSLVGCLRTLVHMAEFVGWKMLSPYEIGPPRLTGLDPEFIHFGGTLVKSLLSAFDPSSSGTMLESSVSQFVQCAMSSSSGLCTKPDLDELEDDVMIDFREVFLPPDQASAYGFEAPAGSGMMGAGAGVKVKTFLDSSGILGGLLALGAADGGGGGSGSINKEGALVSADVRIPLGKTDTRIKLEIKQLRIENADSIEDLSLFNPVPMQAHIVNNSVTMGTPQKPLRIAASVLFGVSSGNKVIRNEMQIQLDLAESQLITEVMLRISQKKLLSLSVKDMMEKSSDCLLSSLLDVPVLDEYGVRISNSQLSFSFRNVDFIMGEGIRNMTCVNCESHEFQTMSHLLQQPNEQEDAGQQFEKMINSIVSTLIEGDASYVQNKIDQYLVNASKHCAVTNAVVSEPVPITGFQDFQSPPEDSALDYILAMLIVMLAIMLFTLCICVFVRWVVTRRHRKWLRTLSRAQILSAYQAQSRQKEKEAALSALSKSMFQSKEVNTFAKYFIPFTVLGNIALFLSGHLSPGGSIRAYMGLAGQHIVMDDVYNFSIAQSALDLWNSDGKVLSTVMFLFSMIWPYLKQVVTMVVWFLPTTLLSLQQRRKILHDLDRLAKWSMV